MTATKTTRSNRPLTSFACGALSRFLSNRFRSTDRYEEARGNTTVWVEGQKFGVELYGSQILEVQTIKGRPSKVLVSFTETFDGVGMPTRTVRERLNGLLDTLGQKNVLPCGVRVFVDLNYKVAFLGRNDDKVAVGRDFAQLVSINPDHATLDIQAVEFDESNRTSLCVVA